MSFISGHSCYPLKGLQDGNYFNELGKHARAGPRERPSSWFLLWLSPIKPADRILNVFSRAVEEALSCARR